MRDLANSTHAALLPIVAVISSCSPISKSCDNFPEEYSRIKASEVQGKKVSLSTPIVKSATLKIEQCYPKHSYMGLDNKVEFVEAVNQGGGSYLIVSEIYGINDVGLVFRTDKSGNVVNAYQLSMR